MDVQRLLQLPAALLGALQQYQAVSLPDQTPGDVLGAVSPAGEMDTLGNYGWSG